MAIPDHFCPGCGASMKAFPRYPWHFCRDCAHLATDKSGHPLEFSNQSLSGGFMFRRQGEDEWVTCGSVIALINGRRVKVTEARFGGIVAEPFTEDAPGREPYDLVDLTRPGPHRRA